MSPEFVMISITDKFKVIMRFLNLLFLFLLASCNAPPSWEIDAKEFLESKNIDPPIINSLINKEFLSEEQLQSLYAFSNSGVIHLIASNPGTPNAKLVELSQGSEEGKWGVAQNQYTPAELLLSLRTVSQYSTTNCYLAKNPSVPSSVLVEMLDNEEVSNSCLVYNSKLPVSLMRRILESDEPFSSTNKTGLAQNPGLPIDLMEILKDDSDELIRAYLAINPNLTDSILEELLMDESEMVRNWAGSNHSRKTHHKNRLIMEKEVIAIRSTWD